MTLTHTKDNPSTKTRISAHCPRNRTHQKSRFKFIKSRDMRLTLAKNDNKQDGGVMFTSRDSALVMFVSVLASVHSWMSDVSKSSNNTH